MSLEKPEVSEIRAQTTALAGELSGQQKVDLAGAWKSLRASHLPFVPILFRHDLETAHRLCSNVLRAIGKANMGIAYALENHLYVLG